MNLIRAYAELTKPRITCFILMSTAIGFLFGMPQGAPFAWPLLLHTLLGTALIASGTAGLNQWYERLADARMNRTKARPIPSGRITKNFRASSGCPGPKSSSPTPVRRKLSSPVEVVLCKSNTALSTLPCTFWCGVPSVVT